MLTQPLPDLHAWTAHLLAQPIPVLGSTAASLQALAQLEATRGTVDAHRIGEAIAGDPLMTLRVLADAAAHRTARQITDAETVTAAVMLMGLDAFFQRFGQLETVEERLAGHPGAMAGLQQVLDRAWRAARFALGFAVHRMDTDAAVVHEAALLHDVAEMLLWCHAPALATDIARRQHADPALRSGDAQQAVLHVRLADLGLALLRALRMPERLIRLHDPHASGAALALPQARCVELAVRLARHTAEHWHGPALPDDIDAAAALLNLAPRAAEHLLVELNS